MGGIKGGQPGVRLDGRGAGSGGVRISPDGDREKGAPFKAGASDGAPGGVKFKSLVPQAGAPVVYTGTPTSYRQTVASPIEQLQGALSFRPHLQRPGALAMGNWLTPTDAANRKYDYETPVVCRLEPYGAQGGTAGVGTLDGSSGQGVPWILNFRGGQRYPGGTGAGGLMFMPAEVSATDRASSFAPGGVTVSDAYFAFCPGTYLALGLPDYKTGGIVSGHRINESSAATVIARVDSSGTPTTQLTLPSDGGIRIAATSAAAATDGDLRNDSTQKALQAFVGGLKQTLVGCPFSQIADVTVANTGTETTLVSTGAGIVGTATLPANFFTAGKTIRLVAAGIYSTAATVAQTLTIRVKYGSTTLVATAAISKVNVLANRAWSLDVLITCRTVGGTGTVYAQGVGGFFHWSSASVPAAAELVSTGTVTIDTTAASALSVTAQWNSGAVGDTITCTNLKFDVEN